MPTGTIEKLVLDRGFVSLRAEDAGFWERILRCSQRSDER